MSKMALPWRRPLNLDIPSHPAADILSEDELSSAVDHPEEWDALKAQCYVILSKYQPREAINDDTETFLQQVIQHLPKAGQVVLMKETMALDQDHGKLRQLRNFFVDAILKPSEHGLSQLPLARTKSVGSEGIWPSNSWHFTIAASGSPIRN
jgi:hypothetical protein